MQWQALHPAYTHLTFAYVSQLLQVPMATLYHKLQGGILGGQQAIQNAYSAVIST